MARTYTSSAARTISKGTARHSCQEATDPFIRIVQRAVPVKDETTMARDSK